MKRILILSLTLFLSYSSFAQNILELQNDIISELDKEKIPYGVLYDKVVPLADLKGFTSSADSSVSNPIHFHQAYFEFYHSLIHTEGFTSPTDLINDIDNRATNGFIHPLGILLINFSTIDEAALTDGRLWFRGTKS